MRFKRRIKIVYEAAKDYTVEREMTVSISSEYTHRETPDPEDVLTWVESCIRIGEVIK